MTRVTLDTGNNGIQLQLEYGTLVDAATGGAITSSTSSVKMNQLDVHVKAGSYSFYDTSNKLVVSGTIVYDATFTNVNLDDMSAWTDRKIATCAGEPRTLLYHGTQTGTFIADLQDVGYSGRMTGNYTFTIPRREYTSPVTPSVTIGNGSANCTGHQLDNTKDKFWSNTDWRLETNGTFADLVMNGAGDRSSATFTTAVNNRYRVAVRAKNPDATGGYGYSGYYYTTPAASTLMTATRRAGSPDKVDLTWKNNARYIGSIRLISSASDGSAVAVTLPATATSYTATLPLNFTGSYYVQAVSPEGVNTATSASSNTASVGLGYTTPSKPTSVTLTRNSDSSGKVVVGGAVSSTTNPAYWAQLEYRVQKDNGAWPTPSAIPGTTTSFNVGGWVANSRYRVGVRSKNSAGVSDWVYSGYVYTTPAGVSGLESLRPQGTDQVILSVTGWGQWANLIKVERSLNGGSSWASLGSFAPGMEYYDSLTPSLSALYRFQAQTPSPYVLSAKSNELFVPSLLVTDRSGIPGVDHIYAGSSRVRQVFSGSSRLWTDGDE